MAEFKSYNYAFWVGTSVLLVFLGICGPPSLLVEGLDCPTCLRIGPNGSDTCTETKPCNNLEDYKSSQRDMIKQKDDIMVKMRKEMRIHLNDNDGTQIWEFSTMDVLLAELGNKTQINGPLICAKYLGSSWVATMQPEDLSYPYTEARCAEIEDKAVPRQYKKDTCSRGIPQFIDIDQVRFHVDKEYCTCDESTISKCQVSQEELLRAGAERTTLGASGQIIIIIGSFCFLRLSWLITKLSY